ncbi:putative E3 ubiquitin-protein ligase [Paratrimastix pyriformis]|uniref:E3 ubiquitin-protein ligase n=1 Tax=Paratrimastix pyriformis TaxID=342808 RepID=A0ABQ8UN07_9EUKA|nr:putative E3 ubiquitin-protein ligase [Paratrimastix pyriformis]
MPPLPALPIPNRSRQSVTQHTLEASPGQARLSDIRRLPLPKPITRRDLPPPPRPFSRPGPSGSFGGPPAESGDLSPPPLSSPSSGMSLQSPLPMSLASSPTSDSLFQIHFVTYSSTYENGAECWLVNRTEEKIARLERTPDCPIHPNLAHFVAALPVPPEWVSAFSCKVVRFPPDTFWGWNRGSCVTETPPVTLGRSHHRVCCSSGLAGQAPLEVALWCIFSTTSDVEQILDDVKLLLASYCQHNPHLSLTRFISEAVLKVNQMTFPKALILTLLLGVGLTPSSLSPHLPALLLRTLAQQNGAWLDGLSDSLMRDLQTPLIFLMGQDQLQGGWSWFELIPTRFCARYWQWLSQFPSAPQRAPRGTPFQRAISAMASLADDPAQNTYLISYSRLLLQTVPDAETFFEVVTELPNLPRLDDLVDQTFRQLLGPGPLAKWTLALQQLPMINKTFSHVLFQSLRKLVHDAVRPAIGSMSAPYQWSLDQLTELKTLLQSRVLYHQSHSAELSSVLEGVVASSNPELRRFFLDCLTTPERTLDILDPQQINQLSLNWFEAEIHQAEHKRLPPLLLPTAAQKLIRTSWMADHARAETVKRLCDRVAKELILRVPSRELIASAIDANAVLTDQRLLGTYARILDSVFRDGVNTADWNHMAEVLQMLLKGGIRIPSRFMEDCIMALLDDPLARLLPHEPIPIVLIVEHSTFWLPLLRLTKDSDPSSFKSVRFLAHEAVVRASDSIRTTVEAVQNGTLTVEAAISLLALDHAVLESFCTLFGSTLIGRLAHMRTLISAYEKRRQEYETLIALADRVADVAAVRTCLAQRQPGVATLAALQQPDFWGILEPHATLARQLVAYQPLVTFSRTVANFLAAQEARGGAQLPFETLAAELHAPFDEYMSTLKALESPEDIPVTEGLRAQWHEVDVSSEVRHIASVCELDLNCAIEFLESMAAYNELQRRANSLLALGALLETKPPARSARFFQYMSLRDPAHDPDEKDKEQLTLPDFHKLAIDFDRETRDFSETMWACLLELSQSQELLRFLRRTEGQDLRVLSELVGEYEGSTVTPAHVTDLVAVASFLRPLFVLPAVVKQGPLTQLIPDLVKWFDKPDLSDLPRLTAQLHALNAVVVPLVRLYEQRDKHGEATTHVIECAARTGALSFALDPATGTCGVKFTFTLTHRDEAPQTMRWGMADLTEMRSRALLLVSSVRTSGQPAEPGAHADLTDGDAAPMRTFIEIVDQAQGLVDCVGELLALGHFGYRNFAANSEVALPTLLATAQRDLRTWRECLEWARQRYFYLTFYHGGQILLLHDFFLSSAALRPSFLSSMHNLLRFVEPSFPADGLAELRQIGKQIALPIPGAGEGAAQDLACIGAALSKVFERYPRAPLRALVPPRDVEDLSQAVQPGRISVVIPRGHLVNVIMSLFLGSRQWPAPAQLLICTEDTEWEQLNTMLSRAFSDPESARLYCVAGVEQLPFGVQSCLVEHLRYLQIHAAQPQYRLALICAEGGEGITKEQQHLLNQFASLSSPVNGTPDAVLHTLFAQQYPNILSVTSDASGVGKTQAICGHAYVRNLDLATFLVSGSLDHHHLVESLCELPLLPAQALHLDICAVENPEVLNMLLFQLLVVGMVSSGASFFYRPPNPIYMEVASTPGGSLAAQLQIHTYFEILPLGFDMDHFVASQELLSPVQVVCNYLLASDEGRLLTEDLLFPGPRVRALSSADCARLLKTHLLDPRPNFPRNYSVLGVFLRVFASQLLCLSHSMFFRMSSMKAAGAPPSIRQILFRSLFEESLTFAVCTTSVRSLQQQSCARRPAGLGNVLDAMIERTRSMVRWQDTQQLLVVFHHNCQSISLLYREVAHVPQEIAALLRTSMGADRDPNWRLEDYQTMDRPRLRLCLERICRGGSGEAPDDPEYALTPDNILKMVMVMLRVNARCPVVIMGETGCGKTSLVRYLAALVEVDFRPLNIHAGTSAQAIVDFVHQAQQEADDKKKPIWLFLDECNTCEHLGLVNDLVCHHQLLGVRLDPRITIITACNPFRKRDPGKRALTAGLENRVSQTDPLSQLVYRVHPLPDAMLDWVWDYGILDERDEARYVEAILRGMPHAHLLTHIVVESQRFIRHQEAEYSVSLRDVRRVRLLVQWFLKNNIHTRRPKGRKSLPSDQVDLHAIFLGLCHVYHSRLSTGEQRGRYRELVAGICEEHGKPTTSAKIEEALRTEQIDYLERMELPPGTALNQALLENVFVALVCIINRIPVFVVGKPGCSKSLSVRLITTSLKGRDSRDPWFRQLPSLYVVPYQGSDVSTSEGILHVFRKAREYLGKEDIIPMVLLDEVGLAEVSRYNPLKVLHSLLEPNQSGQADVAVVGISNWALDAAKMNRAIYLSRPEPDVKDLYETACSILSISLRQTVANKELRAIAEAYSHYQQNQSRPNFHGLRDFFALVKSVGGTRPTPRSLFVALERNFGGLPRTSMREVMTAFRGAFSDQLAPTPLLRLVEDNLADPLARNLLLITTTPDATAGMLGRILAKQNQQRPVLVLFGSQFERDCQSDEYSYRVLSRIILAMETGRVLIMKGLKSIYGSLFEMLNQSYTVIGNRRNCQVALGPFANHMCFVHPDFRCVVLVEPGTELDECSPPFLNRFEKQQLSFGDVLSPQQEQLVLALRQWVLNATQVEAPGAPVLQRAERELRQTQASFLGFDENTIPALVLAYSQNLPAPLNDADLETVRSQCQQDLLAMATPDGLVRALRAPQGRQNPDETRSQCSDRLASPLQANLRSCYQQLIGSSGPMGIKAAIGTFSNIFTDVGPMLAGLARPMVVKLGEFKSERDMAASIHTFWSDPRSDLLVIQADPTLDHDGRHLLLAKFLLDEERREYYSAALPAQAPVPSSQPATGSSKRTAQEPLKKHVLLLLHMFRTASYAGLLFNSLCGWQQVTVEALGDADSTALASHVLPPAPGQAPAVSPATLRVLQSSLDEILGPDGPIPFARVLHETIQWALFCNRYPPGAASAKRVRDLAERIEADAELVEMLQARVRSWVEAHPIPGGNEPYHWQVEVACDQGALLRSTTFFDALHRRLCEHLRQPLALLLHRVEQDHTLDSFFEIPAVRPFWRRVFMDPALTCIEGLQPPREQNSLDIDQALIGTKHHIPGIAGILAQFEDKRDFFEHDMTQLDELNSDDQPAAKAQQTARFRDIFAMVPLVADLTRSPDLVALFAEDFVVTQMPWANPTMALWVFRFFWESVGPEHPFDIQRDWWLHGDRVVALLRFLEACQPVVNAEVLEKLPPVHAPEEFVRALLELACAKLRPNAELLGKLGLDSWQRMTMLAINRMLDVCHLEELSPAEVPYLWELRCFHDLARTLLQLPALRLQVDFLVRFASEASFGTPAFFDHLAAVAHEVRAVQEDISPILSVRFHSLVLARSVEVSHDQEETVAALLTAACTLVESYQRNTSVMGDLATGVGPILNRLLSMVDESTGPELITNPAVTLADSPLLIAFNACLEKAAEAEGGRIDSLFATLVMDAFEKRFFPTDVLAQDDPTTLRHILPVAMEMLTAPTDAVHPPIARPASAALLRSFLGLAAEGLLPGDPESRAQHPWLSEAATLLADGAPARDALRLFLLKQTRPKLDLAQVRSLCTTEAPRWLEGLPWALGQTGQSRFGSQPFALYESYAPADVALQAALRHDLRPFELLLAELGGDDPSSTIRRVGCLGAVLARFVLPLGQRDLEPIERARLKEMHALCAKPPPAPRPPLPPLFIDMMQTALKGHGIPDIPLTPALSDDESRRAVVLLHLAAVVSSLPSKSPNALAAMLRNQPSLVGAYLPTMPGDPQFSTQCCSCGCLFAVGKTGDPLDGEHPACAKCRRPLTKAPVTNDSGSERDALPSPPSVPGYLGQATEAISSVTHTVRGLPAVGFRLIHLLMHAVLHRGDHLLKAGLAPATPPLLVHTNLQGVFPAPWCMDHVAADFECLRTALNTSHATLSVLLHAAIEQVARCAHDPALCTALTSPQARALWEVAAIRLWAGPLCGDTQQHATETETRLQQLAPDTLSAEDEIEERPHPQWSTDPDLTRRRMPRFFRTRATSSFATLRAAVLPQAANYPLLALVFERTRGPEDEALLEAGQGQSQGCLLNDLYAFNDLLAWPVAVVSRLNYRLSMADPITIQQFLDGQRDGVQLAPKLARFLAAWDRMRRVVGVGDQPPASVGPILPLTDSIRRCVPSSAPESRPIATYLQVLAGIQRRFLLEATKLVAEGRCPALGYLVDASGKCTLRAVRLSELQPADLIDFQWESLLSIVGAFGQCHPEPGHGSALLYDLDRVEVQLGNSLVLGKALPTIGQADLPTLTYSEDFRATRLNILPEIARAIPQGPLDPHAAQTLARDQSLASADLLGQLGLVLSYLHLTRGDPAMSLSAYCNLWLRATSAPLLTQHPLLSALPLGQVVDLFHTIEAALSEQSLAAGCVPERFKSGGPDLSPQKQQCVRGIASRVKSDALLTAVLRFASRFASTYTDPSNTPLAQALAMSWGLWPPAPFLDPAANQGPLEAALRQVLPIDFVVGDLINLYRFLAKERHDREKARQQAAAPRPSAPAPARKPIATAGLGGSLRKRGGGGSTAFVTIATSVTAIPATLLVLRKKAIWEFCISIFANGTSVMYHLCEALNISVAGMNAGQWHRLDNIGAVLTFAALAFYMMDLTASSLPLVEGVRWAFLFFTLWCQERGPWKVEMTVIPCVLAWVIFLLWAVRGMLPKYKWVYIYRSLPFFAAAFVFFAWGLDDDHDLTLISWFGRQLVVRRLRHGMWHFFIGLAGYVMMRARDDTGRNTPLPGGFADRPKGR